MTPDPLLLFPLAALAVVILCPSLGRNGTAPGSLGDSARRRQALGRMFVITLPVGAVLADIRPLWPEPYLGEAAQALLFVAIVMLPLVTAHVLVTRRRRRTRVKGAVATASDASRRLQTLLDEPASARAVPGGVDAGGDAGGSSPDGWSLTALRPSEEDDTIPDPGPSGGERGEEGEAVRVPIGRQAERVESGGSGEGGRSLVTRGAVAFRGTPVQSATDAATATNPESVEALKGIATELRGMRGRDIVGLVHALRTDRVRLRRLVIARQAAYVAERRARERAHAVTRDAIGALQRARAMQTLVEKVARRERRERRRVEARYERTARALDNAMSIIRGERHPLAGGEGQRETVRPEADGESGRELETH